jgi:hypothetical protein
MEVNLAPVAIEDLCRDAERSFRPVAEERGLAFRIEVDPALPPAFVTDEQRLSQVLRNLLSNAFKFTHEGSVELALRRRDDQVVLSVTDTGVGIADGQLALIFEAFQQADGTTSRKYGGTGWACPSPARSRACSAGRSRSPPGPARARCSRWCCRSWPGRTWRRPTRRRPHGAPLLAPQPAARPGGAPAPPRDGAGAPPPPADDRDVIARGDRVLLVVGADHGQVAAGLAAARRAGARGLVAHGAPSGLAAARELRPDAIVLLDAGDPGHELLGRLKQHPETRHRPVILTGPPRSACAPCGRERGYATDGDPEAGVRCALEKIERRGALHARRLAVVQDGDPLDHATLTLLGAGDDVDVVELSPARRSPSCRTAAPTAPSWRSVPTPTGPWSCSTAWRRTRPGGGAARRLPACAGARAPGPPGGARRAGQPDHRGDARAARGRHRAVPAPREAGCPSRRAGCSPARARPTRDSGGARCSWSTTTSATSSRWPARSSSAGCRSSSPRTGARASSSSASTPTSTSSCST